MWRSVTARYLSCQPYPPSLALMVDGHLVACGSGTVIQQAISAPWTRTQVPRARIYVAVATTIFRVKMTPADRGYHGENEHSGSLQRRSLYVERKFRIYGLTHISRMTGYGAKQINDETGLPSDSQIKAGNSGSSAIGWNVPTMKDCSNRSSSNSTVVYHTHPSYWFGEGQ